MVSLSGQVAVVTGSTRGIGRAIAERFGRAGARVVVSSSTPAAVSQAAAELRAQGLECAGHPCDVSDRAQVAALLAAALDSYGQVDIWVNNAAISGPFAYTLDVPPDVWERVIAVNLFGTLHGCRAVLPHMIARGRGKIVNLTGGGYKRAQRFLSAYSCSKAAIVRLTEALAREHAAQRFLSFNVLAPGIVSTDMTNNWEAIGAAADALKAFPRVRQIFGTTAEETAELALTMVGPANDRVSGKVFEVMPRRRALLRIARAAIRRS